MVVSLRISFILKQIGDQFRKTNAAYCGTQTIIQSAIADFSAANTDLFTANADLFTINASLGSAFVFILSHFPLFVYPISLFSVKNPTCYAAQVCYSIVSCKTISFCHSDPPFLSFRPSLPDGLRKNPRKAFLLIVFRIICFFDRVS